MSPGCSKGLWALLVFLVVRDSEGGCRSAGLCCPGRDMSCLTKDRRIDGGYGDCFCDQACLSTLDCCHDYDAACPAIPCLVSEWTHWSGCAEPCRATVRVRQRTILQEAQNSAPPCPALQEHAGCAEYSDQQGQCRQTLVPALITTGGYGNARKKREVLDSGDTAGYCVEFQLTSLTDGCARSVGTHTRWMQYLREGHHVCVECQPPALAAGQTHCSGDGENSTQDGNLSLQWQAVGNPRCRGLWKRVRRQDSCTCPSVHSFLFI